MMLGFGPLSELTQDMTPEDRAEVDRIKAEMQREEDRLLAAEAGGRMHGAGPRAGRKNTNRPGPAATARPSGALKDSAGPGR